MTYAQTYLTGWVGERMLADLRTRLFGHLQRLSLGYYERNRAGVIISRLTNDVEALDQLVTDGVTSLVQNTLTLAGTAILLFVLDWRLALGTLFAFMLYFQNFFDPVQQLSQLYNTFLSATAALDKIMAVLDEEPEVRDRPGARDLPRIAGHVRFEDVRFRYGRGDEVLHGIDLDVPAGTTVALVGHPGAGKSTIAKLLARFYHATAGRITIDGTDDPDVTPASLRRQLGVVPQEGFLFAGTLRDNVAFGRPEATDAEIRAAAQA